MSNLNTSDTAPTTSKDPNDIFVDDQTFADLGLRSSVLKGLEEMGFEKPTAIQASMIPPAIAGKDILGQAKTGTGKTAAFGLPIYHMIEKGVALQVLILAPTRELAIQISSEMQQLGKYTPLQVVPIYGGQPIKKQQAKLERNPEIIVGTPGRVMDLVGRGILHFRNIRVAVLDEVDRMLDIGFREDIRKILNACPKKRQTIFVSATISPDIEKLARSFMVDAEKLVTAAGSLTVSLVEQHYMTVQPWDKRRLLVHLLTHEEPALTLVFCRLKRTVDELVRHLQRKNVEAHAIHADLSQSQRDDVMRRLRSGELSVLIASDLAARGIDVEGISHVINYDLPEDIEIYVHRIGRTARAGRGGIAWSFVTPEQGTHLTQIELLINAEIPRLEYPDFDPGPMPADFAAKAELEVERKRLAAKPSRYETEAPAVSEPDKVDESKFPGGMVPTKLPPKRMQGKMRTGRQRRL